MTADHEESAHSTSAKIELTKDVVWKIHPAIGFARVGNSPSEYFVASDTATTLPCSTSGYRDNGDPQALRLPGIKRQAALFRVFAYDGSGVCLGEVSTQTAIYVEWSVTLANKKASGSKIGGRHDVTRGRKGSRIRNPQVSSQERWRLDITPQPRHVSGFNQRAVFNDGRFMDIAVCLGEIRTDTLGRLLVLGGSGQAGTYDASKRITTPTDNDYWYDDISDGPVTATLTFPDGRKVAAEPAWVVVTPPDFAPGVQSIATQFDVLMDHATRGQPRPKPSRPSFVHDILPVLRRIVSMQWVNREALASFANEHGALDVESMLSVLAMNNDASKFAREAVLTAIAKQQALPITDRWLSLTATQFDLLQLWATGEFDSDWSVDDGAARPANSIYPTPQQLDRAALDACAGSAVLVHRGEIFFPGDDFRIDHRKLSAGGITESMPCPWHADVLEADTQWSLVNCPKDVLTAALFKQVRELDDKIVALTQDGAEDEELQAVQQRRHQLWMTREFWARGLPDTFPARAESLVKEWQHLGFVIARAESAHIGGATRAVFLEQNRSPHLGSLAEYFHRLVNFEENLDFAPKALEMAYQMLGDAKFTVDENYTPFRYTPGAFDERLEKIYNERVRELMYSPISWESGKITWNAVADYGDNDDPIWKRRRFNVGQFSDAALRERFFQFAPENMTDGAWLQNIVAAAPMNAVQSRLASIWLDEVGSGRVELNHSNIYVALMNSLNTYLPPVTSREFIEQDFVPSAFLSPVFQFCVGRFPKRFLPELLGMTLFMEWEATPISTATANMMAERHIDPQYYRMHAGIDNVNAGHGALAKEAVKLYLNAKLLEGGDAIVQEHWHRIWRGYVAWATLGNGHDEVVERMMLIDKKQIHVGPSLLTSSDILRPCVESLRTAEDPVSRHLRSRLDPATRAMLAAWSAADTLPDAIVDAVRNDLNECLREGIYNLERFAEVQQSANTAALRQRPPQHSVDVIDLGRCLLEDAYPDGIIRRGSFPNIKRFYADRMIALLNRKAAVARLSHRRIGWLNEAFSEGPDAVMDALLTRGFIDLEQPELSRLFGKTEFGGPMFKVFSEDDQRTIIEWVASVRGDASTVVRPQPIKVSTPASPRSVQSRRPRRERGLPDRTTPVSSAPETALADLQTELGTSSIH